MRSQSDNDDDDDDNNDDDEDNEDDIDDNESNDDENELNSKIDFSKELLLRPRFRFHQYFLLVHSEDQMHILG